MPPESAVADKASQLSPVQPFMFITPTNMCEIFTIAFLSIPFSSPPKANLISSVYQPYPLTTSFPKGKYNPFLTIQIFKSFLCAVSVHYE